MKMIVALFTLVALAVADEYHHSHHEDHHYAPTKYYYDVPAMGKYGDHAITYVNRDPHSVHYDMKEHGPHGSHQHVNFEQKFGGHKGYH